jgi:hypothetical protein
MEIAPRASVPMRGRAMKFDPAAEPRNATVGSMPFLLHHAHDVPPVSRSVL